MKNSNVFAMHNVNAPPGRDGVDPYDAVACAAQRENEKPGATAGASWKPLSGSGRRTRRFQNTSNAALHPAG